MVSLFLIISAVAPLSAVAPYVRSSPSASFAVSSILKTPSSSIVLLSVLDIVGLSLTA